MTDHKQINQDKNILTYTLIIFIFYIVFGEKMFERSSNLTNMILVPNCKFI